MPLRFYSIAVAAACLGLLAWRTVVVAVDRAREIKSRPPSVLLASVGLDEDSRIKRALDDQSTEPSGKIEHDLWSAFSGIRAHTPSDAVVAVYVQLSVKNESRIRALSYLLYPRTVRWYEPLRQRFAAHPEELNDRIFVLSLAADPFELQQFFAKVGEGPTWTLWHYLGAPR